MSSKICYAHGKWITLPFIWGSQFFGAALVAFTSFCKYIQWRKGRPRSPRGARGAPLLGGHRPKTA